MMDQLSPMMIPLIHQKALLLMVVASTVLGCYSRADEFTQGRLHSVCSASIPVCQTRATCVVDDQSYIKGVFPGAERAIIYAPHPRTQVHVRILLDELQSPGTEFMIRAFQIGCIEKKEERIKDTNIFIRAGGDRVLDFTFDLEGRGDHLIEWFSDATAKYVLNVDFTFKAGEE